MVPISSTLHPIPQNLKEKLASPMVPWMASSQLNSKMPALGDGAFTKVEILPGDPEHDFLLAYFLHNKPRNVCIKKAYFIKNSAHEQAFESELVNIEYEGNKFEPKGKNESPKELRSEVIKRWEIYTNQFSPIEAKVAGKVKQLINTKVFPLWHGSNEIKCRSICESGFTFFGKHGLLRMGSCHDSSSTDIGYFGSGIYFTNSAQYASKYSQGHLIVSWVSMREPYPVVSNTPSGKPTDMIKLEGLGAYQKYNAHYIPVSPTDPTREDCIEYYPCVKGQRPTCDEIVVFQKAQTLPRFWIELQEDPVTSLLTAYEERALFKACKEGNCDYFSRWIKEDESRLKARGMNEETPAYFAAQGGSIPILSIIYSKDPNQLRQKTAFGATPFYAATLAGQIETMRWLDSHHLSFLDIATEDGWSLFTIAVLGGNLDEAKWIYEKAPHQIESTTQEGWSPFYIAALKGNASLLEWLTSKKPEDLAKKTHVGENVVCAALSRRRLQALQYLYTVDPALFFEVDFFQNSAMHGAVAKGYIDIVRWLCSVDPAFVNCVNKRRQTPLHLAAEYGQQSCLDFLFENKALLEAPDLDGKTPVHYAVIHNQQMALEKLVAQNASLLSLTTSKENVIHLATEYGHLPILTYLFNCLSKEKLSELLIQGDSDGKTPLHKAVWLDPKPNIVSLLLAQGIDPNIRNNYGYTPLHWAAKHGHLESAKLLIEKEGKIDLENANGDTPFDLALRWGTDDVARFMIDPEGFKPLKIKEDIQEMNMNRIEEAYRDNRIGDLLFYLEKSGDVHLGKQDYKKASLILTSALAIAEKLNFSLPYQGYLLNKFERMEGLYLEKLGLKTPPTHRNHLVKYRSTLKKIRSEGKNLLISQSAQAHTLINTQLLNLFKELIDQTIAFLGPPPTTYACIGMGALGRQELFPHSSIKFAILIEKATPEAIKYFQNSIQCLELKIIHLGETPCDLIPPLKDLITAGFTLNKKKASLGELLIHTPKELAAFHKTEQVHVSSALVDISLITGTPALLENYYKETSKILESKAKMWSQRTLRKVKAVQIVQLDAETFKNRHDDLSSFYRFLQKLIRNLSLYYGVREVSTFERIEKLTAKKVFSKDRATEIKQTLRKLVQWLLEAQLSDDGHLPTKEGIEKINLTLQFLLVASEKFANGNEKAFM